MKCIATTQKGTQCSRQAIPGEKKCQQHLNEERGIRPKANSRSRSTSKGKKAQKSKSRSKSRSKSSSKKASSRNSSPKRISPVKKSNLKKKFPELFREEEDESYYGDNEVLPSDPQELLEIVIEKCLKAFDKAEYVFDKLDMEDSPAVLNYYREIRKAKEAMVKLNDVM